MDIKKPNTLKLERYFIDKITGFEIKYYIGTCDGENEEFDRTKIMEKGAKFPKEVGDLLMWP